MMPLVHQSMAEPLGGKPPDGERRAPSCLADQLLRHRAMEAVLWSMPAVSAHGIIRGSASCGGGPNSMILFPRGLSALAELLTPDVFYPRIYGFTDLRHGPVVVKMPPDSPMARLRGQIVDHMQCPLVEIRGGRRERNLLLLPPGYTCAVPDGFVPVRSPSHRLVWAMRSVPAPGATWHQAVEHVRKLEISYLDTPKPTEFIEPAGMRFSTLPRYDERWFHDLDDIIQIEPAQERDSVMRQMLASLGIRQGKPFKPDTRMQAALRGGAIDAYFYMHDQVFGPSDQPHAQCEMDDSIRGNLWSKGDGRVFMLSDRIDFDKRALRYFIATFDPEGGSDTAPRYIFHDRDSAGFPLDPHAIYQMSIPANRLHGQDWALAVYDRETCAFIYTPSGRNAISFNEVDTLKLNADGSATLYLGPHCPQGMETNWIDSCGKHVLACIILFNATDDVVPHSPWPVSLQRVDHAPPPACGMDAKADRVIDPSA